MAPSVSVQHRATEGAASVNCEPPRPVKPVVDRGGSTTLALRGIQCFARQVIDKSERKGCLGTRTRLDEMYAYRKLQAFAGRLYPLGLFRVFWFV